MGERWRALSPEEKRRFEDMASADKIRFQLEMQEYTTAQEAAQPPPPPSPPRIPVSYEHMAYQPPLSPHFYDPYYAAHYHHAAYY